MMVGLATLMDSSRLILVGLATLTGSSRLILVGLATLTSSSRLILVGLGNQKKIGSSRLILVGLGNLQFLQVKHSLRVGWRNFFSSCTVVSVFGSGRKQVLVLLTMYLCTQSTIELWCCVSFLVLAGNSFWCCVCTQCTLQLCGCVSFLVVARNCSLNENTFLQKNLIGLLFMICQPMCVFYKT